MADSAIMSAAGSAASERFADAHTRAVSELLRGSYLMAPDALPDLVARVYARKGAEGGSVRLLVPRAPQRRRRVPDRLGIPPDGGTACASR